MPDGYEDYAMRINFIYTFRKKKKNVLEDLVLFPFEKICRVIYKTV